MRAYILAVAGAVLISAVITIIAPNGKMGKFLKGALKLVTLAVLISPLLGGLGVRGGLSFDVQEPEEDAGYYRACAEMLSARDGEEIAALLKEEFSVGAKAEVVRKADPTFAYEKITVNIYDFGIIGQGEHKDISQRVQAFLGEKYKCTAVVT